MGMYREDGTYLGVPTGDTKVYAGDTLILYGRTGALRDLDTRRDDESGQKAHEQAVGEQQKHEMKEKRQDEQRS